MPHENEQHAQPFRFSLRVMLLAVTVVSILFGISVKLGELQKRIDARTFIKGGLMQVGPALSCYADRKHDGLLPPAVILSEQGEPLFSWRAEISADITSPPTSLDRKAPWNDPTNQGYATWTHFVFTRGWKATKNRTQTTLFAIAGDGTAFNPLKPLHYDELHCEAIIVMEAADSGVHWMEPGDYDVEKLMQGNGLLRDHVKSHVPGEVYVLFADGDIWSLDSSIPMEIIKPFFLLEEAKQHSRENELGEYCLYQRIASWNRENAEP